MSKFVLAEELDPLEYDFRMPDNPEAAHGVVPEPSSDQLNAFRASLTSLIPTTTDASGKAAVDTALLAERVKTAEEGSALEEALYATVAALCSNTPSVDDIKALPFRGQRAFVGWIMGTFATDPQSAPATKS